MSHTATAAITPARVTEASGLNHVRDLPPEALVEVRLLAHTPALADSLFQRLRGEGFRPERRHGTCVVITTTGHAENIIAFVRRTSCVPTHGIIAQPITRRKPRRTAAQAN